MNFLMLCLPQDSLTTSMLMSLIRLWTLPKHHQITIRHLKKLGMRFINHEWIMVREPKVGNFDHLKEDVEVEASQEPALQWSPFESLMIQKMDAMLHLHQEHSAEVHSLLENIANQLENIEIRLTLSNLLNLDEDEA